MRSGPVLESEASPCLPFPNEGVVGNDQDQPYWRMLWKSIKLRLPSLAFCLRAFCQQRDLCMGNSLDGSFLHLGFTSMNNLSTLADIETKVVGISFWHSFRSSDGISTGIYLKVIAPITIHPLMHFKISFLPFFTICNYLVYLFIYVFIVYSYHYNVGSLKTGTLLFSAFLYPQNLG